MDIKRMRSIERKFVIFKSKLANKLKSILICNGIVPYDVEIIYYPEEREYSITIDFLRTKDVSIFEVYNTKDKNYIFSQEFIDKVKNDYKHNVSRYFATIVDEYKSEHPDDDDFDNLIGKFCRI